MTTETTKGKYNVIGTRPIRHDGYDKVTGRAIYGADIKLPGLLQGAVLRSPHAHARIKSIDTGPAKAVPGVYAVITGADFPGAHDTLVDLGEGAVNFRYASNNIMAGDKVLYKGHPVAAVAAVDKNTALEAAARADAQSKEATEAASGKKRPGRKPKTPPGTPKDSAQRNFTDPDSRIMKTNDGYIQGYNGQAAVDAAHQVIVAQGLSNKSTDQDQLAPMVDAVALNTGSKPKEVSADAGYCSEANLEALEERRVNAYVATGRQKHGQAAAVGERQGGGARVEAMRRKLKRGGWRSRYRLRKQVVEPVFGQIKEARGFRRFLLRGLGNVGHEWGLISTVHNLLKLGMAANRAA